MDYASIKIDDYLRIGRIAWGASMVKRSFIVRVVHVTARVIYTEGLFEKSRKRNFSRKTGKSIPSGSLYRVLSVASQEDVDAFYLESQKAHVKQQEFEEALRLREQKRLALQELFPVKPAVNVTESAGMPGRWEVSFPNLTETEVKQLAAVLTQVNALGQPGEKYFQRIENIVDSACDVVDAVMPKRGAR